MAVYLSLCKYTDPFLLRDITSVFQEWRGPLPNVAASAGIGDNQTSGGKHGAAAATSASGHLPTEVSFSEMLDVLYHDITPDQHRLMHSWIPAPINRESVKQLQSIFDRLDTEFTGKVKFAKVMHAFRTEHAENETYQKLMEPFSRLRPHRLEIAVNIRELLTALFNRTHPKQLKKIIGWSRPSKLLTPDQQNELIRLFQQYDTRNEGRFPFRKLKDHLMAMGLTEKEVEAMTQDVHLATEEQLARAAALRESQRSPPSLSSGTQTPHVPHSSHGATPHPASTPSPPPMPIGASPSGQSSPAAALHAALASPSAAGATAMAVIDSIPEAGGVLEMPPLVEMEAIAPAEPMMTLQEFSLFYRSSLEWGESYVNIHLPWQWKSPAIALLSAQESKPSAGADSAGKA
jgi:Ca2+-binding EF-hand superfamily protein